MAFNKWLDTYIDEAGIELEDSFDLEGKEYGTNFFTYGAVVDAIKATTADEKAKIKNTIVMIDFKNGDVRHFFRHLAGALVI